MATGITLGMVFSSDAVEKIRHVAVYLEAVCIALASDRPSRRVRKRMERAAGNGRPSTFRSIRDARNRSQWRRHREMSA